MLYFMERALAALSGKGYGSASIAKEVACARRFCRGGVLFDVGANKGSYTRELIRQFGDSAIKIYCFDPATALVRSHLQFADPRVDVVNAALGAKEGSRSLFGVESQSGLSSLTQRRLDHFGIAMTKVQEVDVTTLDSFANTHHIEQIDLLKLDVEGHELDVLKGGADLLSQNRIKCIQFEFGGCNIDTRTYFQDFWYLLHVKHGFSIYRISPFAPIRINRYRETDEVFLTTNYIAVHNR